MSAPMVTTHGAAPRVSGTAADAWAHGRRLRRLLVWIGPVTAAVSVIWGAVPGILLPQQLAVMDPAGKVGALALVASVAAGTAMVAQPVAGRLSDRTRSRFGRRAPWIIVGAVGVALCLTGLAAARSVAAVAVCWALMHVAVNLVQAPLAAVMPDRVPPRRRGSFAALSGVGLVAGTLGGQALGAVFFTRIGLGYVVFGALSMVMLLLFVLANRDTDSRALPHDRLRPADIARTFWVSPRRHPDFAWAFVGRFLLYSGYYAVLGYQLFVLTDYLHVRRPGDVVAALAAATLVATVATAMVSGPLSDRVGRRKPFVFGASLVTGCALLLPWAWPTLTAWSVAVIVSGVGLGMYQAVDTALITEVLPGQRTYGKDLGVVNLSSALPQTAAPAVAGAVVALDGYAALFPVAIGLGVLGALAVSRIRGIR